MSIPPPLPPRPAIAPPSAPDQAPALPRLAVIPPPLPPRTSILPPTVDAEKPKEATGTPKTVNEDQLAPNPTDSAPPPSENDEPDNRPQADPTPAPPPATPASREEIQQSIEDLEDVRVKEIYLRLGKGIKEVRSSSNVALDFPTKSSFTNEEGVVDWQAFISTWAMAAAAHYIPESLLAPAFQSKLSLTTVSEHLSRCYLLFPPEKMELLLDGSFPRFYRWQSPNTWKWCLLYIFLWIFDLIPLFPALWLLFELIKVQLFRPSPPELLRKFQDHTARSQEATELSTQIKSSNPTINQAKTLLSSSLAFGSNLVKSLDIKSKVPSGLRSRQSATSCSTGMFPDKAGDTVELPVGEVSLYKIVDQASRQLGPFVQEMMEQVSDLGEKVRNLFLHPEHPAMRPTCARLLAICAFLLFTPTWIQIKSFWAYLGLEIFVLFRLRETFPEYRWALTPIWWLFLGVPTDFEFAMEVTRRRGLQGKTLGPHLSPRKPSSFEAMMKKVGSDSTPDPSEPSAEEVVASHFALYKKTPGNIVITTRSVQFHAIRGFRTFSSLVHKKKYELVEDSASVHSDLPGKLVDIGVEEISGVKKGSILGGGFTISLSGGTVHTFDGVSDPSSAFVNLLSVAPSLSRKA